MARRALVVAAALSLVAWAGSSAFAEFPDRTIEIVVPFGVGNAADVTARFLAEGMAKRLGVSVVVANRPGGGGAVAFTYVQQRPADGYTLGYITSTVSTNYYAGILQFDHTAFAPIARVTIETPVLVVRSAAPWQTVAEMVQEARQAPGKLRIGNSGTGTHTHLSASALFIGAGATVIDVPFGEGGATVNLLGERVEGVVQLPPALIGHVKSGELRVLAALGSKRDRAFPDTPTATEAGFPVALDLWRGIVVPKGAPPDVIAKLDGAIRETVVSPEFEEAGLRIGFLPAFLPASDFAALIAGDDRKLADIMAELGLKKR